MKIMQDLTESDYMKMEALEGRYYTDEHITPWQEAFSWYEKYPWSTRVMSCDGEIAGFLDLFPIKKNIYESLSNGTFNDKELTGDGIVDILSVRDETMPLFLCCMVVDEAYRKKGVLMKLLKDHLVWYDDVARERNLKFSSVITDNVTPEGERFSVRMGFNKITETRYDSVIYEKEYADFRRMIEEL